jgi:hypothetical protein
MEGVILLRKRIRGDDISEADEVKAGQDRNCRRVKRRIAKVRALPPLTMKLSRMGHPL